jgi:cell division protein FtsI/penicillin-binding protein 2
MHAIERVHLVTIPRLDRDCETLAYAIAHSQNAIIAKLAHRFLDPSLLERYARAFGFGEDIPFPRPLGPSIARIPADPLEFARTAAGFWNTSLSPLHAALLANAIAAGGWFATPGVVEPRRIMTLGAAQALARMMVGTTREGTARLGFHDAAGHPLVPYDVAGKTGSLSRGDPYLGYSWFVGFAPAERPQLALAVLVGNDQHRRVRAHVLAGKLLAGNVVRLAAR